MLHLYFNCQVTLEVEKEFPIECSCSCVSFVETLTSDGNVAESVATGGDDGRIYLWPTSASSKVNRDSNRSRSFYRSFAELGLLYHHRYSMDPYRKRSNNKELPNLIKS